MARYDTSWAYDQVVKRGLPGQVARVTDAATGAIVDTILDLDGNEIDALVSNSQGFLQPFMIIGGPPLITVTVGSVSYDLIDLTKIADLESRVEALELGGGSGTGTLIPGTLLVVKKVGSSWPLRPTSLSTVVVAWQGSPPFPPIVASGTGGMRDNIDVVWRTS